MLTPDAEFELAGSTLGGSRYVAACDGCQHRSICRGIRPDYLARYGEAEFAEARRDQITGRTRSDAEISQGGSGTSSSS